MHPDIKVIFEDRPDDPIEAIAADLLKVVNDDVHIDAVVDIVAFAEDTEDADDPDRIDRLWEYFKHNAGKNSFMEAFYMEGHITLCDVACEYLTDLLIEHKRDLETLVALSSKES